MEDIFVKKDKFKHIVVEKEIVNQLNKLNQGSPNKAIKHLLNVNPDSQVVSQIKELQADMSELQDKLESLVRLNNLRI